MAEDLLEGVVLKSTGKSYRVLTEDGSILDAGLKGKMRTMGMRTTNPVAVGDRVRYHLDDDENGIIVELVPRKKPYHSKIHQSF